MTKVVFLLFTAPPNVGLQEKRMIYIIIKTRVFVLPDQRKCARLHLRCTRVHAGLQSSCDATFNDGTRVTADMDMYSIADACA